MREYKDRATGAENPEASWRDDYVNWWDSAIEKGDGIAVDLMVSDQSPIPVDFAFLRGFGFDASVFEEDE